MYEETGKLTYLREYFCASSCLHTQTFDITTSICYDAGLVNNQLKVIE